MRSMRVASNEVTSPPSHLLGPRAVIVAPCLEMSLWKMLQQH